jgi:putative nucleotidyltransferase with HDIG domain
MSTGNQKRKRSERVAQLELPPNRMARALLLVRRNDVWLRVAICLFAVVIMWMVTGGWYPNMPYRTGMIPERDIFTRQTFERDDDEQTRDAHERARQSVECVYDHDGQVLVDLREGLKDRVFRIVQAESFGDLDKKTWQEFLPLVDEDAKDTGKPSEDTGAAEVAAAKPDASQLLAASEAQYEAFVEALADDPELSKFTAAIENAFETTDRYGLLENLEHDLDDGSQTEICVHRTGERQFEHHVKKETVLRREAVGPFREQLKSELDSAVLTRHIDPWLTKRLPDTLRFNPDLTREAADRAVAEIGLIRVPYVAGEDRLAAGGKPLTAEQISLLKLEHKAWVDSLAWPQLLAHAAADLGMYAALYILCGVYVHLRHRELLRDLRRLTLLQAAVVVTVVLAWLTSGDSWQAELIPLMLFGMTVSLAYRQELALLLSASACLIVVLSLRQGLVEFVILTACLAATILLLREVRTRTKLIFVGLGAGAVAVLTTMGAEVVAGASIGWPLLLKSLWYGFCAVLSGVLMTGLLPFVEQLLDVQTDISLLELGDVSHPLLQELVRRAPGTYNHSINVASIAESAAESIGANGLMARVGAYFHDIGKMLKPQYFIENQSEDGNRHEALLPAMSTLIIIAHVKDGADLARQHHLPQMIIDFILQHHGTTLVEYFYVRASKQSETDPDAGEVDEGSYRYPGPKPQTREAAVLMLADSVESASRSFQDPAPARIEGLVHEIAMKRLLDGQFDECGLTLRELRAVEDSLVKSLTAMYHGRVKYPDQQSA